ncbi:MAG: hypothetical protein ACQCXQ_13900, partial [Verrucomicrobiales bacterium]
APAGSFVATYGATAAVLAPAGTYVDSEGASTAQTAAPGTYVPNPGSTAATVAEKGYYVSSAGQSSQTAALSGTYVPVSGATAAVTNPVGTWSPDASPGVRTISPLVATDGSVIVGPVFGSNYGRGETIDLGAIREPVSLSLDLSNNSGDSGFPSALTTLSLAGPEFGGDPLVALESGEAGPLAPGEMTTLVFEVNPGEPGTHQSTITIQTDEFAEFMGPGSDFVYTIDFEGLAPLTTYGTWRELYFSETERFDPLVSGPTADPDGDGLDNTIEYAFGFDPVNAPTAAELAALPRLTRIGETSSIGFSLPETPGDDLIYRVEASTEMTPTTWVSLAEKTADGDWSGEVSVGAASDGRVSLTLVVPDEPLTPRRFFRVSILTIP